VAQLTSEIFLLAVRADIWELGKTGPERVVLVPGCWEWLWLCQ